METSRNLATLLPFAASAVFATLAWGAVSRNYLWPRLRDLPLQEGARPILHLHLFRFVGLGFIVPGVVGAGLQSGYSIPTTYGDLIAMALAWLALLALSGRWSLVALWAFNLWGFGDLVLAFYHGISIGIDPANLGATWYIPTFAVPLLLWTHVMMFGLLVRDARVRRGDPDMARA